MRTVILTLCIGISFSMFAQAPLSEDEIEKISYEQFQNKQFKEHKETVKIATKNGVDFYYLRLRAGILAYNKKKYEYAIPHFKKALEFFPADTLSKEYLYYAYLFSDRKETANDFASKQDIAFQQKDGYKKKPFDFIGVDGGLMYTKNISDNKLKPFNTNTPSSPGKSERTLNGNLYFGDIYFQNTIKNRLHISNSFSIFSTSSLYQIEVLQTMPTLRTFKAEKTFTNLNFQYNLGLSYSTKKEWTIAFGFGYYRIKGNTFTAIEPDIINNRIPILQDTIKINSFLGSVSISKRFKYIEPRIQISASNLNSLTQIQAEAGIIYYPLGNYNFYGTTLASFLRNGNNNQYVIGQKIGFKVLNWWWNEILFNYGNLSNYQINNGIVTYNTSDAIKLQTGIDFNFYIKKHFQIGINYTLQQREKTIQEFGVAGIVLGEQKSNYLNHLLKTSLQWNF